MSDPIARLNVAGLERLLLQRSQPEMVFDRRFNAASPRYLGSASNAQQQKRRAPPAALGLLRPLDPVLLNGVDALLATP